MTSVCITFVYVLLVTLASSSADLGNEHPEFQTAIDQIDTRSAELDGGLDQHPSEPLQVVATVYSVTEQLEQLKQHKISADNRIETLNTQLANLSERLVRVEGRPRGIRHCRVCFYESEGSSQCQGVRSSCSGWSSSPSYTQPFRDDTDNRSGGCHYQWLIECE